MEKQPELKYGLLDEVQIIGKKGNKIIDTTILKATKSGNYIWKEKLGAGDVNPDKRVVMRVNFQHAGKIEIYYYVNEPDRLWIATKSGFSELTKHNVKIMWSGIVKTAHMTDLIGQYTKKATDKRWNKYKDAKRELRRRMKEQNVDHEALVSDET